MKIGTTKENRMTEITENEYSVNQGKMKYLDAVKGFCIILVVISHAGGIPVVGSFLTACYMQVFFFVGGITYKDRYEETFGKFAIKKAKRLLIPYFAYAVILLLVDVLLNQRNITEIMLGGAVSYTQDIAY